MLNKLCLENLFLQQTTKRNFLCDWNSLKVSNPLLAFEFLNLYMKLLVGNSTYISIN